MIRWNGEKRRGEGTATDCASIDADHQPKSRLTASVLVTDLYLGLVSSQAFLEFHPIPKYQYSSQVHLPPYLMAS